MEKNIINNSSILEIYRKNEKLIKTLARRYSNIDPAVGYEDLISEGFLAVIDALESFDKDTELSFSSHLWWYLQKRFNSTLGKDKVVEVKYDGVNKIISYNEFLRIKKSLPEGVSWRVVSLLSSLEDLKESLLKEEKDEELE